MAKFDSDIRFPLQALPRQLCRPGDGKPGPEPGILTLPLERRGRRIAEFTAGPLTGNRLGAGAKSFRREAREGGDKYEGERRAPTMARRRSPGRRLLKASHSV